MDEKLTKKRRVTKACDQCRRRRIKCETDPVNPDGPCQICTQAGPQARSQCTFSRETRKRGPQAGYAKSLAEKSNTLERLLGHLLIVSPAFSDLADSFFDPAESSISAEAQLEAFSNSVLAAKLEAFISSPAQSTNPTTSRPLKTEPGAFSSLPSSSSSSNPLKRSPSNGLSHAPASANDFAGFGSHGQPGAPLGRSTTGASNVSHISADDKTVRDHDIHSNSGWSPTDTAPTAESGPSPPFASSSTFGASPTPIMNYAQRQMHALNVNSPSLSNPSGLQGAVPSFGGSVGGASNLQALANAASSDSFGSTSAARLRAISSAAPDGSSPSGSSFSRALDGTESNAHPPVPGLPAETVRNHLLDLYFNQVVHPVYPMLDKARVIRWSFQLPSGPLDTHPPVPQQTLPPELYLAIFASVAAYLPSDMALKTHTSEGYANAARTHLFANVGEPTLERVQSAALLALVDWGQGELSRAWTMSALSLALAINLNLHVIDRSDPQSRSAPPLQTFHAALIIHTALSLRLLRPPMIVLEDYDVPTPDSTGPGNFELWRSDKTPDELRAERDMPGARMAALTATSRRAHAVRSSTLAVFSKMASLCAIGTSVIRWGVCPRRGNGQGLAAGDRERQELVQSLLSFERDLSPDLRLGEGTRGVDKIDERAPAVLEMHLLLFTFLLRLAPHPSYKQLSLDPVPQALVMLHHILTAYRNMFSFLRSMPPAVELALHTMSCTLFLRPDYQPQQHDLALEAYAELGQVLPVAKTSFTALGANVDAHKRAAPTATTSTSSAATTTTTPGPREVGGGGLSYLDSGSSVTSPYGTTHTASSYQSSVSGASEAGTNDSLNMQFTRMMSQSDLLRSLGLVSDPANLHPWMPPTLSIGSSSTVPASSATTPATTSIGAGAAGNRTPTTASQALSLNMMVGLGGGQPQTGNPLPQGGYQMGGPHQAASPDDLLTRWLERGANGGRGTNGSG